MEAKKADQFIASHMKYFPEDRIDLIKERLIDLDDGCYLAITGLDYKKPVTMLFISVFLGILGVDRFLMGEKTMGFLKLFTLGLFGILLMIDWFTICNRCKEMNFDKLMEVIWE